MLKLQSSVSPSRKKLKKGPGVSAGASRPSPPGVGVGDYGLMTTLMQPSFFSWNIL